MAKLTGILPAVVTPFKADLSIDFDAFRANLDRLVNAGCAALCVNAVTGEGLSLSPEERTECVRQAVSLAGGRVPVIASAGSVSDRETIEDLRAAERVGAGAVMIVVPYFYRLSRAERVDYFVRMGRSTGLPLIVYNTTYSAGQLDVDDLEAIAEATPNFVGLKEGAQLQATEVVRRLSSQVAVYTSRDTYIHELGASGGSGAVTYTSNVAPELTVNLWKAVEAGDFARSMALQQALNPVAWGTVVTSFPAAVKAGMNMLGWQAGPVRPPLHELGAEAAAALRPVLEALHPGALLPQVRAA